jgi:hypothetical protein
MRDIYRKDVSSMIRRARATARQAYALSGRGELRVAYTEFVIRPTNAALCRSEIILLRIDAGGDARDVSFTAPPHVRLAVTWP